MSAMKANLDEFIGLDRSVDEFRRWALSDWKSPTTRAQLAEYYVRCALGLDDEPIGDWEHVDIYLGNDRIEVKASAHLQPARGGEMKRTSPRFDIKEREWAWSNEAWDWMRSESPKRWADCYVLCLESADAAYDPLDLSQWKFFVLSTPVIDRTFGRQKTVSVGRLRQEGFRPVAFGRLEFEIRRTLGDPARPFADP